MWCVASDFQDAVLIAATALRDIRLLPADLKDPDARLLCWAGTTPRHRAATLVLAEGSRAVAAALDAGVEDAACRSADPDEIAARLSALLRKRNTHELSVGALRIARFRATATYAGQPLALLPREHRLLLHLAENAGRPCSRASLLEAVWGMRHDPGTNVVAVHVSRLRRRLSDAGASGLVQTDPGEGYRLLGDG